MFASVVKKEWNGAQAAGCVIVSADFLPISHLSRVSFTTLKNWPRKWRSGSAEDLPKLQYLSVIAQLSSGGFECFFFFFFRWFCVSLEMPKASHICLDCDELTPRQIQDIYSGMPRGHTVGGDVVAVRVASFALPPPSLSYDFAPLFSASCPFFSFSEKRRGWISKPIPAQFMNVTVTCWTALTSAEVNAHQQTALAAALHAPAPAREREERD